jgi:hypothetical protein
MAVSQTPAGSTGTAPTPIATPATATRPSATTALESGARKLDQGKLSAWGLRLKADFDQYERDRKLAELKWARNARQFLGIYDPDIESQMDKQRSMAYPKLTRVKCVSMVSRIMNMMFPASDKNWALAPSPVPNLSEDDLNLVLQKITEGQGDSNAPIEDQVVEIAIKEFAKERARNLELEIEDQLLEAGGSRALDYPNLCRKVLYSGVVYGMGVLKGPYVREQKQRSWERNPETKLIQVKNSIAYRPHFDHLAIWDYYPDLSAKYRHQMDGQFERMVLGRHQLRALADRPDFIGDQILEYLKNNQRGNYRRRAFESEIKAMGVQQNVNDNDGRKYEVVIWDGYVSGADLAAAGVEVAPEQMADNVEAIVWILDSVVIKAEFNPWKTLDVDTKVNSYHHFIFEEDESTLLGNGLPNIMRDSALSVAASARMLIDNASVTCGPQLELNRDLLDQGVAQDVTTVRPYKIWYRRGTGADAQIPLIKDIQITSHMDELLKVMTKFEGFADTETFVGPATGGDMQKGPSEPFRTAAGASMLRGDAALPFKDVVRNFDMFSQSVIGSLVAFNRQFNPKPNIQGDAQVVPRGATSLVAKEVRGMTIDAMAATLPEEEKRYLNHYEMLQERLRSRDFDVTGLVCSKAEADLRDKAAADSAKLKDDATNELMRAEIREVLSSAVKNLTQSDKNAAGADAAKVKSLMEALDAGITDDANATPGAAGPDARPADGDLSRKDGPGDGAPPKGDGGAPSSAGAAPAPV